MIMKNGKNRGEIEEKQGIIQSKETKSDQKPEKASSGTFSIAFHCKHAEIVIYNAKLFSIRDSFFFSDSELKWKALAF